MIEIDDQAKAAITNARALLDAMLAGGWNEVCVQGEEGDYFLARQPGTRNPLIAPPAAAAPPAAVAPLPAMAPPAPALAARAVTAPHVGTVVWLAPVGTAVDEGAAVARLAVLDETVEVAAPAGGTVASHGATIGDLAEFKTELVTLQG